MSKSKSKKMSKAKKTSGTPLAAPIASITLSNPAPNTLEWSLPVIPEGKAVIRTEIDWRVVGGTVKEGGIQIFQFEQRDPDTRALKPLTIWENGSIDGFTIPAGTWEVKVVHFMANVGVGSIPTTYDASTMDNGTFSDWVTVTFN